MFCPCFRRGDDEFYEFTAADYYKLLATKRKLKLILNLAFDDEMTLETTHHCYLNVLCANNFLKTRKLRVAEMAACRSNQVN